VDRKAEYKQENRDQENAAAGSQNRTGNPRPCPDREQQNGIDRSGVHAFLLKYRSAFKRPKSPASAVVLC
jgi:hypothetical protein